MSLESDIAVMRLVPSFESFGDEHLRLLAFGGENRRYSTGQTLFRVGDSSDGGFVVLTGAVELTMPGKADETERYERGSLFGRRALLARTRRIATATAVEDTEVLMIRRTLFMRMLSEFPDLAERLHDEMVEELHALTDGAASLLKRDD